MHVLFFFLFDTYSYRYDNIVVLQLYYIPVCRVLIKTEGLDSEALVAGRMLLYHPLQDEENYMNIDVEYRDLCCQLMTNQFCIEYFGERPNNKGENYESPALGQSSYNTT